MKIQMVDLHSQYQRIKSEIDAAMQGVSDNASFINGPEVREFASELESYMGVKHVIPCANGTDALQIAMMALDIQSGREVLVPSWTYVATVEVIALLGLRPVFVEVDPVSFNLDVEDLENKITSNCSAIVPVHLYGQCANMDEIMEMAKQHGLYVIEDTAQALGADYTSLSGTVQKAGTIGHVGTTSFFPSKNLGCFGDGGAMMTNDEEVGQRLKTIANHGQKLKYINETIGVNSRLDTLQAAILKVKLKYLDEYTTARRAVASRYDKAFKNQPLVDTPVVSSFSNHVYHQYTLKLKLELDRDAIKEKLFKMGIPSMVYYPIPNHLQKAYSYFGSRKGDLPITERLSECVLSLPIHTEMHVADQNRIIDCLNQIIEDEQK